jgi:hypothetical protein
LDVAGRGGRTEPLGFKALLAAALMIEAPGKRSVGFATLMAGRGGRTTSLDFKVPLAAALVMAV